MEGRLKRKLLPVGDFSTGKLASPKAMIIFSTGKLPVENFFSLYLTSDLSSVAEIRKELMATDKKDRRGRQTGNQLKKCWDE